MPHNDSLPLVEASRYPISTDIIMLITKHQQIGIASINKLELSCTSFLNSDRI